MVIKKNSEKKLEHESRNRSIKEGIFAKSSFAIGNSFISPFAIAINASNSLVAMLSSFAGILGPLSQIFGSKLMKKNSRKKIVVKSFFIQSLLWIPFILLGILFSLGILENSLGFILLLFFSLLTIFSNISHPAWFSWIGDVVDEKKRGKWFSKRNLITGFISLILTIFASFLLDYLKNKAMPILGFLILFLFAMIFKLIAWKNFKKQYEPKLKLKKQDFFSFKDFLKNLPKTNFGKFTIFRAFLAFSISITSPLIAIYLLRNLNLSYIEYTLVLTSGALFSLLFLELWGKISDRYGNYRVLVLTTFIIPIVPILWILSNSVIYLIFVPSLIGGVVWSGFLLASVNFIYDNVSPQKRGLTISYFNMMIGKGIFLGAGLGALLIKYLKIQRIEPIFLIFIIGSLTRMLVVYVFLPKVKEVRKTKKFKGLKSLKKILLHETMPTLIEEKNQIIHIKKYIY